MIPLDPSPGEVAWMDLPTDSACRAGDYESLRASGPRKPGKSPGGKLAFPGGLFPGFPRMLCIRVGRQRRPGQKHNGGKFCYPFQATAGICFLSASSNIRRRGCRGSSPAAGSGAAEAPASPSFSFNVFFISLLQIKLHIEKAGHESTACFYIGPNPYTNSIMTISAASPRRGPSL